MLRREESADRVRRCAIETTQRHVSLGGLLCQQFNFRWLGLKAFKTLLSTAEELKENACPVEECVFHSRRRSTVPGSRQAPKSARFLGV